MKPTSNLFSLALAVLLMANILGLSPIQARAAPAWEVVGTAGFSSGSADVTTLAFDSDTLPPDAPVVTSPPAYTNDSTPIIRGSAEPGSLINVLYFDDLDSPTPICQNSLVNGTGDWFCVSSLSLPEREIELTVNATDEAHNTSSDTSYFFTVDFTDPAPPDVVSPSADAYVNAATPAITGTAEGSSRINIWYVDDNGDPALICQDILANESGDWSCTSAVSLPERYIEIGLNAVDATGNMSLDTSHFFTVDVTDPIVDSIVRVDPDHTDAASVAFTVSFSEDVTGVDTSEPYDDFHLTTMGLAGVAITAVSGSASIYTVTVDTGFGSGTIRLDLVDNDTIRDLADNPLGGVGAGNGSISADQENTITKTDGVESLGVFRPSNGLLYLKNQNENGFADIAINYGIDGDDPVVGDWDGNGTATIGVYRKGKFYLRNSNTIGYADIVFAFGVPDDQPIAGDWDGDGIETVGIYRPSTGRFLLLNNHSAGAADLDFYLGNVDDIGIAGDWDGDGIDTTGVFRPSNGIIFLKNKNETGYADIALNYGIPADMPVTGDWNNDAIDTIGVYRNGIFYLRNTNDVGFADIVLGLGYPGDIPIAGNWDGLP